MADIDFLSDFLPAFFCFQVQIRKSIFNRDENGSTSSLTHSGKFYQHFQLQILDIKNPEVNISK